MLYCAPADLFTYGMPRGAVPNPGRLLSAVSVSADTLTLDVHGLAADDVFYVRAEAGGVLPSPLAEDVAYYARPLDEARFQVSLGPAPAPVIDITAAGDAERVLVIVPLNPLGWIRWASRIIDDNLPAHVVPLVKVDAAGVRADEAGYDSSTGVYPETVVMTCAELAIGKGLGFGGTSSKTLSQAVDFAQKRLARWAAGVPVRNAPRQAPANLAVSASAPYRDPRGWNRWGGT